jgi:hypothetical protein
MTETLRSFYCCQSDRRRFLSRSLAALDFLSTPLCTQRSTQAVDNSFQVYVKLRSLIGGVEPNGEAKSQPRDVVGNFLLKQNISNQSPQDQKDLAYIWWRASGSLATEGGEVRWRSPVLGGGKEFHQLELIHAPEVDALEAAWLRYAAFGLFRNAVW